MRDESRNMFVTYYKLWRVRGRTVGETPENIDMLFTTFDEKKLENGVTELKGPRVVHLPNGEEKIIQTSLLLESGNESPDDGGGGHLLGKWNSVRVMCRAESDDFIHWKNPSVVFEADENDRESANIQLISVFEMGGYYLAFVAIHDQRGFFEQQLAFSADGINWKRPWRGNLISRGAKGEFDSGMVVNIGEPIVLGNSMVLYYGASEGDHTENDTKFSIGRAFMRRDGFACWDNTSDEPALISTVPLSVTDRELRVNVNAEGGWIVAALCRENGEPIEHIVHFEDAR